MSHWSLFLHPLCITKLHVPLTKSSKAFFWHPTRTKLPLPAPGGWYAPDSQHDLGFWAVLTKIATDPMDFWPTDPRIHWHLRLLWKRYTRSHWQIPRSFLRAEGPQRLTEMKWRDHVTNLSDVAFQKGWHGALEKMMHDADCFNWTLGSTYYCSVT